MQSNTTDNRACYFLSLEVENIACFGSRQTLNLKDKDGNPARWTVIIGDNGTGKTTLLSCLSGISPQFLTNSEGFTFDHVRGYWKYLIDERTLNVKAKYAVNRKFSENDKVFDEYSRSISQSNNFTYQTKITAGFENLRFVCHAYGATRQMSSYRIPTEKREFYARSLFDDDAPLINAEEWLLQLDYISAKDQKNLKYKKKVEDIIINLLPDVTKIEYRFDKSVSNVLFETPSGWVGINQLGLGYRTMLAWMVDFAAALFERYPESENPLEEPAVLLLDEIDLHLHPKWQRTIIDYLNAKFPNTQFIVTAHSPLLVQAAQDANIVLLRRKGDDIIIDNDPVAIKNWRIDQILTSDLFGIDSARAKETQTSFKERTRLLSKGTLSTPEKEKLENLERQLEGIPFGETREEIEADFLVKEIARKLNKKDKGKKSPND